MKEPSIVIRRHPYEEPYHTQLEFIVSNGVFSGTLDIYVNVKDIGAIGKALKKFPVKQNDSYQYEYGSENPKLYHYFMLRAYRVDAAGHCALQFAMNRNRQEPDEGICRFSISPIEPAAINRLGEMLEQFAKLKHLEIQWMLTKGELFVEHQFA